MPKNMLIYLLYRFKKFNIKKVNDILENDESVLMELASLSDDVFKYGIKVVKTMTSLEDTLLFLKVLKRLSKNKNIVNMLNEDGTDILTIDDIRILDSCELDEALEYVFEVLFNTDAKKANINVSGAKILATSLNKFNAFYGYLLLINPNLIDNGIALEAAKIINKASREFNAFYANRILSHKKLAKLNQGFLLADLVVKSKEEFNASGIGRLINNQKLINSGLVLEAAKVINEMESDAAVDAALIVFADTNILIAGKALELARLMKKVKNPLGYNYIFKLLKFIKDVDIDLLIETIARIAEIDDIKDIDDCYKYFLIQNNIVAEKIMSEVDSLIMLATVIESEDIDPISLLRKKA